MEVLLLTIMCASNILCFMIGARVGQKAVKGEEIKLPTVNPMEAVKEHRAKKAQEAEQERVETILRNIESYDGTAYGQKEVPRG